MRQHQHIQEVCMNICYCTDSAYVQHCAVSLCSLLKNAREEDNITVYIVSTFLTNEDKGYFYALTHIKKITLHFVVLDESILAGFPVHGYMSAATYLKLVLPYVLPPHVEKVLYLDCDTVVLDSLHEIYTRDLGKCLLGAVPDINFKHVQELFLYHYKKYIREYYNTGVLLMNVQELRSFNLLEKARAFCQTMESPKYWVQDILNYVLPQDSFLLLPCQYNFMAWYCPHQDFYDIQTLGAYQEKLGKPCVIHYTGAEKPWLMSTLKMLDSKYASEYFHYLQYTSFKDFVPDNGFLLHKGCQVALISLTTPGVEQAAMTRLLRVDKDIQLNVFTVNAAGCTKGHEQLHIHALMHRDIGKVIKQVAKVGPEIMIFLFAREHMESGCTQLSLLTAKGRAKVYALDAYANSLTTIKKSSVVVSHWMVLLNAVKKRLSTRRQYTTIKKSGVFDERYYLFTYPDVLALGHGALKHYLLYGAKEGRDPAPWFHTQAYLRANPDVQRSGLNPLYHYVRYGCGEQRRKG